MSHGGRARGDRQRLVATIVESIGVGAGLRRIAGLVPMPGFRALLDGAMQKTADHSAVLLPPNTEAGEILELVETGEAPSPSTPHGFTVPYVLRSEWGAYAVDWKVAG